MPAGVSPCSSFRGVGPLYRCRAWRGSAYLTLSFNTLSIGRAGVQELESHVDPETIADNLSKPRANLLLEFEDDEPRNTPQLRDAIEGDRNSVRFHMVRSNKSLQEWGLAECIGYDEDADTPGDNDPYLYTLTDRGREVREVYRERAIETAVDISKFDELRDEVESLRGEVEKAEKERVRLREERDRMRGKIEHLEEEISHVEMRLNDRLDGFKQFLKTKLGP